MTQQVSGAIIGNVVGDNCVRVLDKSHSPQSFLLFDQPQHPTRPQLQKNVNVGMKSVPRAVDHGNDTFGECFQELGL